MAEMETDKKVLSFHRLRLNPFLCSFRLYINIDISGVLTPDMSSCIMTKSNKNLIGKEV